MVLAPGGSWNGCVPLLRALRAAPEVGPVTGPETADLGPRLENTANNASADGRRRLRFERREVLWRASSLQRVRHCGRVPRSNEDGLGLRLREGVAGVSGLQHCGSVWADPVCAGRVLLHRALEIGAVLGRAIEEGYVLAFVTLTMQHHRAQTLALLWGAGQKGWRRATGGRAWTKVQRLLHGWVRVWEVTYGANGWHVHVHLVLVLAKGSGQAQLEEVAGGMFDRWSRGLQAAGLNAPRQVAQDWHLVRGDEASTQLGGYLAKMADQVDAEERAAGLGLELTHSMPGRSANRIGTRPVWSLLDELVAFGEAETLALWREWETVSRGKRQVGWSRGLRERFAPEIEQLDDDEIVQQEIGTEEDELVHFRAEDWKELVAVPMRPLALLETTERAGLAGAVALLDAWGIGYEVTTKEQQHG